MPKHRDHGALNRVVREVGGDDVLEALAALSGADLTTLQLELMRQQAARRTPAMVLQRYRRDRFAAPSPVPFRLLRRAEDVLLSALPASFDLVTPSPVAPLGGHSVLATVDQDKVVSTVRGNEMAADPTNALALEAAVRRQAALAAAPRSADLIRLAAIQRIVRAQPTGGPATLPHFCLLGLVSAGRDTGGHGFEKESLAEHLRIVAGALQCARGVSVRVRLTVLDPQFERVAVAVYEEPAMPPGADVVADPGRESGRGYYTGLCFKVEATFGGRTLELGDGGFVDWTQRLLNNGKERLVISGIGIDRLALLLAD